VGGAILCQFVNLSIVHFQSANGYRNIRNSHDATRQQATLEDWGLRSTAAAVEHVSAA
jgi:hypothetical protein